PRQSSRPPSAEHFFGTDRFGRDVWARTVTGGQLSLRTGIVAVAVSMAIGFVPGLVAGYRGGWVDAGVGRLGGIMLAFPGILLSLAIVAALGPGLENVQLAIGISLSPTFVRLVRGAVMATKQNSYVEAARAIGCSDAVVLGRHILANILGPVTVITTVALGWALLIATSLNFLGMGVHPPI